MFQKNYLRAGIFLNCLSELALLINFDVDIDVQYFKSNFDRKKVLAIATICTSFTFKFNLY